MTTFLLMAVSTVLLVGLGLTQMWKRSISTFILLIGFSIYFCCHTYGHEDTGSVILAILMFLAYYRAMLKKDNEKIITWGCKK
ncbi:MAG: hypothetical protein ACWGHH_06430 [Sulfurovaceae bacterium]